MDKQARPLQDYFAAARGEPGISEHEVREIVLRSRPTRTAPLLRWIGATIGLVGAVAIGYVALAPGAADHDLGTARVSASAEATGVPATDAPSTPSDRQSTADSEDATASTSNTSTTSPTRDTRGETMNGRNIVRGIATAAAVMGMGTAATAQDSEAPKEVRKEVRVRVEHTVSPAMSQMATELGRSAADFWTTRLNGYKARIDRIVSPTDLDALNRLRVRFGVMLAEHSDIVGDEHGGLEVDEHENVIIERQEKLDGESSDANHEMKREIRIQVAGDGAGAMEFLEMHQSARGIASKYREDFDALGRDVLSDFVTFLRQMSDAGAAFMASHKVEVEKTEDGKDVSLALKEAQDVIASLDSEDKKAMMQMVYGFAAEPLIMLYDGADLRDFFGQGPLSSAVTGLNLPATNVLKQNAPNPAGTRTTIGYELQEPSSATTLRLYDATGALVGTYDQGAREAGEHAETIDLSALPGGVYLYHLTVKTASGERVHSKTMQVAR